MNDELNGTITQETSNNMENEATTTTTATTSNDQSLEEFAPQLERYLEQLIELVPDLKEIDRKERLRHVLMATATATGQNVDSTTTSGTSNLDNGFQNLDLNAAKKISDLQILQSVLDYIHDLQSKVAVVEPFQI